MLLVTLVEMGLTGGNPSNTPTNPYTFSGARACPPLVPDVSRVSTLDSGVQYWRGAPSPYRPPIPSCGDSHQAARLSKYFPGVALWGCGCAHACGVATVVAMGWDPSLLHTTPPDASPCGDAAKKARWPAPAEGHMCTHTLARPIQPAWARTVGV